MAVSLDQFDLLSRLMDAASLRHRVIAQNVANANTPGYRRLEVSFEELLGQCSAGRPGRQAAEPKVVEAEGDVARADGNNVSLDAEMGRLSKNALLYGGYAQILASQIATMRSAITGR